MPDERVHVVIGAGPTGRGVVERLMSKEHRVRVVTRSGRADVPDGVETIAADVSDGEAARKACDAASVVYGCLGLPNYRGWKEAWPPMMQGMLAAAAGKRFVFMDNLYMYGPVDGPVHEALPLTSYGTKPAIRAQITRMWQEAHEAGHVKAAAVRASDFYGPGVRVAMLGDFVTLPAIHGKAAQVLGNPNMRHTFAYVPDVARAIVDIGEADDDVYGQAWHVPSAPARPVREVVEMIFQEAGHPAKITAAPPWLIGILGLFDPTMREVKEMLYQWTQHFEADHSEFAKRFWSDFTPLEQGIPATVKWYKETLGSSSR